VTTALRNKNKDSLCVLALKVDVDTERGTRIGVPNLLDAFQEFDIKATFLFSLGPDNTGRAIKRIFRPGFFSKVSRTSVVSVYGIRTLLNGTLLPGPNIARRHADLMRKARDAGHEVGIHCYDHIRWQDGLAKMSQEQVTAEFEKAREAFAKVFGIEAKTAGAAGWQANANSLAAYDAASLDYASDGRGASPYFPHAEGKTFKALQVPTTLPTLDELLGREEFPQNALVSHYMGLLRPGKLNVLTLHAELEGMAHLSFFRDLLSSLRDQNVSCQPLCVTAQDVLKHPEGVPVCQLMDGEIDGRSGVLAIQGPEVDCG
jgi:undecaprenyl phosphate-alpha-L-ara4FN deformylase